MNYIGKFVTNIRDFYNDLNPATLSGAIDVVVVEQEDGTFACSPFHVRFGKRGVFNRREKIVDITINGEPVDMQMKLGETGEAFFVHAEEEAEEQMAANLATSPLPGSFFPDGLLTISSPPNSAPAPSAPPPSLATSGTPHIPLVLDETKSSLQSGPSSEMMATVATGREVRRQLSESPESPDRIRHESGNDSDKMSLSPDAKKQQSRSRKRRRARMRKQRSKEEDDIFRMDMTDEDSREPTPELDAGPSGGLPRTSSLPDIADMTEELQVEETNDGPSPSAMLATRRLSNSLSFSHLPKEPHHVHFAPNFPTRPIPNESHTAKSEGQLTPPKSLALGLQDDIASGCLSDSEVDLKRSGTRKLNENDGANVTWQWGELPETTPSKGGHLPDTATSPLQGSFENIAPSLPVESGSNTEEQPKPGYLRGMLSFIRRPKPVSPATSSLAMNVTSPKKPTEESGKYLSDLVAEDISSSQKEKYLALDSFGGQNAGLSPLGSNGTLKTPSPDRLKEQPKTGQSASAIQPASIENVPDMAVAMPSLVEVNGKSIELVPLAAQERAKAIDELAMDAKSSEYSSMASSPPLSDTDSEKTIEKGRVYRKTLRLTSDQIKTLPLQMGLNEAEFCIVTKYQGSATCKCNIFLWRYDDKIVISDIDGTITKSDVLGHILPVVGSTWAQAGVAGLYNRINNNGYKFLYLSSRAIGQANFTRDHLRSIIQENVTLPDGPLLLSPKSLFLAFHQEVIVKRPEEFKIACLNDIRGLFPPGRNPFFAAYGNKVTDLIAYRTVGVPKNRIFTINYQGQLNLDVLRQAQSSYSQQSTLVDMVFPPLRVLPSRNELVSELECADEFGSFSFWKQPLPDIEKAFLLPPPDDEPVSSKSGKAAKAKAGRTSSSPVKDDAGKAARK